MVYADGKRKTAKARVTLKKGSGSIRINRESIKKWPRFLQLKILEPIKIAELEDYDIKVNVRGGGVSAQAEAIRLAVARSILKFKNDKKLKDKFLKYDRNMLVGDSRRTEPHKPSQSSKGPRHKRQKSYR